MVDKQSKKSKSKQPDPWSYIRAQQIIVHDRLRTLSYKKSIENNVRKDDIVLDLGCGTGILSFFAAKKGCKKIYAIDKSNIIEDTTKTARLNNLDKYIEFVKEDIFKFKPRRKIDLLIHEQIGYFLWDEDIISKVAYIRDNLLKPDALIIPFKIDLYFVPTNYRSDFEKSIFFWSRRKYDIDFTNLCKRLFVQRFKGGLVPQIISLKNNKTFLCKQQLVYTINLRKGDRLPRKISSFFRLKKGTKIRGMCAYFKVHLDENNVFSTSPKTINTHWGQIFLPCIAEKIIKQDSILNFTLFPKRDPREWKFKFEIV